MKFAALALLLTVSAYAADHIAKPVAQCRPQNNLKRVRLAFPDGQTISVSVADTPKTREKGLMCVTHMKEDAGMLFVFPQAMTLNFWMKNTLVSLDMIWIDLDKKIAVIRENLPASRLDTPDNRVASAGGYGAYVLELPAGAAAKRKLKVGDALEFSVARPEY